MPTPQDQYHGLIEAITAGDTWAVERALRDMSYDDQRLGITRTRRPYNVADLAEAIVLGADGRAQLKINGIADRAGATLQRLLGNNPTGG